MSIHNTEWRLWTPPSSDTPAHIYAGVRLVATVFDYDAANWMVAEHNSRLLIERGRVEQAEKRKLHDCETDGHLPIGWTGTVYCELCSKAIGTEEPLVDGRLAGDGDAQDQAERERAGQ